jgi:cobalt/nickel transport system permease protein
MTAVIATQGFLFQDGGILVMGWNILNMGIFAAFVGYSTYALMRRLLGTGIRSQLTAASIGAWLSVEVGAIATAIELSVSGTSPIRLALPAMAGVHALIGLGEAAITSGAIALLHTTRPEVLRVGETAPGKKSASLMTVGLLVALTIAVFSPFASSNPDGLEFVAGKHGFSSLVLEPIYQLFPDYTIPNIPDETLTTILAVVIGTLVVFLVALLVGKSTFRGVTSRK